MKLGSSTISFVSFNLIHLSHIVPCENFHPYQIYYFHPYGIMSSMWGVFIHMVQFHPYCQVFNLVPWFTHVFTFIYFIQNFHVIILFWKILMCHSLVLTDRHLYPCYEFHPHHQHWYGPIFIHSWNFIHTIIFFIVSCSISCIWFNFYWHWIYPIYQW